MGTLKKLLNLAVRIFLDLAILFLLMVFLVMLLYFLHGSLELDPTVEQQAKVREVTLVSMIVSAGFGFACVYARLLIRRKNRERKRLEKEKLLASGEPQPPKRGKRLLLGLSIAFLLGIIAVRTYHNRSDTKKNWWYIAQDVMDYTGDERAEDTLDVNEIYYYCSGDVLYSYSLAEQSKEKICEIDADAEDYVVREEVVFWVVWPNGKEGGSQIWRYDRRLGTAELYLESDDQISHLTVYDGYLVYGDRMHFCVLPLDGDPKADVFDLNELLADGQQRTAEYGNWRIGCTVKGLFPADKMMYIADKNTGRILLNNNYSEEIWMCADDRIINFSTNGYGLDYRWEGEEESHFIQCLNSKRYVSSMVRPGDVTVEDGKIIGMLTVSLDPIEGAPLPQKYVDRDILFQIDPAEDTSEVIYRTPNNRTRILGYHEGCVCLLRDSVICTEKLAGKDRRKIYDLSGEDWYDYGKKINRKIYFSWNGGNLIVRTWVDGELWIKSIPVSAN